MVVKQQFSLNSRIPKFNIIRNAKPNSKEEFKLNLGRCPILTSFEEVRFVNDEYFYFYVEYRLMLLRDSIFLLTM